MSLTVLVVFIMGYFFFGIYILTTYYAHDVNIIVGWTASILFLLLFLVGIFTGFHIFISMMLNKLIDLANYLTILLINFLKKNKKSKRSKT